MLDKMAGSKWRQMVRDGKLAPYALGELREMGLHGTKQSARKELAGLARGNKALLSKLQIDTRPGTSWRTITSSGLLDLLGSKRTTNKKLIVYPVVPRNLTTASLMLASTRPVMLRHEIDEVRALQKLRKAMSSRLGRQPTNNELDSARHLVSVVGGHNHPSVLIRESGHANIVGGATREHLMELRRRSGEDNQLRRHLGKGYGKLDSALLRTKAGRTRLSALKDDRSQTDASIGKDAAFVSAVRRLGRRLSFRSDMPL